MAGYEDELGLGNDLEDFDIENGSAIAQEVNLLKQASESAMELAFNREKSLQHAESIDQYMDTSAVENAQKAINVQKEREIAALDKADPSYAKKVKEIEARAKQTLYKTMKSLNVNNEVVPRRVKEKMVRRGTVQLDPEVVA